MRKKFALKKFALLILIGLVFVIPPLRAQTWSASKRLTWSSKDSLKPAIAVSLSNNIHVVWYDFTPGNSEIYYKRSTNGGLTWFGAKRLTWSSENSYKPAIAVSLSNNIHVVWHDFSPPFNYEIYYKRSTNGGVTWSGAKRLTWNSEASEDPAIVVDSGNRIHMVWADYAHVAPEIHYKRSTDEGISWGGVKRLTWNSGYSYSPKIAVDSSNTIHVVWHSTGNMEIYYKKSTNGGVSWSGTKRITWNSGETRHPAIAIDTDDKIHVVWHDSTPGNYEIYYRRSINGGASWGNQKRLLWSPGYSYFPAIAVDSGNRIHVTWYDDTPGQPAIYYKKSTNGGVTWSGAKRLSWSSWQSYYPAIAVDSSNIIHVVWEDTGPGNTEIYYKRGIQ